MNVNNGFVALVMILIVLAVAGVSDVKSASNVDLSPANLCDDLLADVLDVRGDSFYKQTIECRRYQSLCEGYDVSLVC